MKIVLATPLYPPEIGGPATYTHELAIRLREKHGITVLAYADAPLPIERVTLVAISKRQALPLRLIRFFFALLRRARGADLIYVQNAVAAGLPVALVSALLGKPFIVKFVGDEAWERATQRRVTDKRLEDFLAEPTSDLRTRMFLGIQKFVLSRARIVTTPSAYLRDTLIRAYKLSPERVVVNYNAAESGPHVPFAATPTPHQIAATARLVAWKGIDGIIRALARIIPQFPDARLVIAGEGPEEARLKALVAELGLTEHVSFLGHVSRAETWHLRKSSAVYVLNSTYEGLPHTALTSFAARIPIIATDIPGTNEAVIHETTGLLVRPKDDDALAQAITRIFTDEALAARLVENANRSLEETFSWKAHLSVLEGFFETVQRR